MRGACNFSVWQATRCGAPLSAADARPRPELRVWLVARGRATAVAPGLRRMALCAIGAARNAPTDGPQLGPAPPRKRGRVGATTDREAAQAEPPARTRRAGNAGERVAGSSAQPESPKRRRRAPNVGKQGETTPDGKPKPDERTVADLVRRGWSVSEEAAVALLTRRKTNVNRYAFETAEPAADWLEATLGPEPVKDGLCPAAKAVCRFPVLLQQDAATLQRKWDKLTLSAERGGVGIAFSTEQARGAVRKHPQLLSYSVETYKTGWSMLTDDKDGPGLPHEEARERILRGPQILSLDIDKVVRRVALLKSLGYEKADEMVLKDPLVLHYQEETVQEAAAWWQRTGLDHVKLVTGQPTLLGVCSVKELQAKLDFLRHVVGMSDKDLNACSLFTRSLDGRLRARFFYALLKHRLARFGSANTMMQVTDATFLAMVQGRPCTDRASKGEVARYQKLVTSASFVAWRERHEARVLQRQAF